MSKWMDQMRQRWIWAGCYLLALALWLVAGFWGWGVDAVASATGRLFPFSLTAQQFELVDLSQQEDGRLLTTSLDPQMIWQVPAQQTVRSLRMWVEFDQTPREMCLYYTTKEGESFSLEKRVFAKQLEDGSYLYTLTQTQIVSLRLDPCSPLEGYPVTMTIEKMELNEPVGFASWLIPTPYQWFELVVYPALAASFLSIVWQGLKTRKNKHT